MGGVRVRQAGLGDLDALALLFMEGHEFHADRLRGWFRVPKGFTIEDQKSYIRVELERGDVVIFVAEVGGDAVGLAEVAMRENVGSPLAVPKKYAYVQSLVVTEAERRGGVGSALMRAVEDWAREQGAVEVQLDLWEFEDGPLGFYEKGGYRTIRRRMVREL